MSEAFWIGGTRVAFVKAFKELAGDLDTAGGHGSQPVAEVVVDNWSLSRRTVPCLIGHVNGHPLIEDGPICTSQVFYIDQGRTLARTFSRWYQLGTPADFVS